MQTEFKVEIPLTNWYKTQSEVNYEHILNIQSELLTIHAKIDMILEALKK